VQCWLVRRREAVLAGHEGEGAVLASQEKRSCLGWPRRRGGRAGWSREEVLYWLATKERGLAGWSREEVLYWLATKERGPCWLVRKKGAVQASQKEKVLYWLARKR
jgi:hypothetical protein